MTERLFDTNGKALINLEEYEIVPESIPPNETPREMVLRMTGRDLLYDPNPLFHHEWTWEEIREFPPIQKFIAHILARFSMPRPVMLKKRDDVIDH